MPTVYIDPSRIKLTDAAWEIVRRFHKNVVEETGNKSEVVVLVWTQGSSYPKKDGQKGEMVRFGPGPGLAGKMPEPVPQDCVLVMGDVLLAAWMPQGRVVGTENVLYDFKIHESGIGYFTIDDL